MKNSSAAGSHHRPLYDRPGDASSALIISSDTLQRTQEADATMTIDSWGYEPPALPASGALNTKRWTRTKAGSSSS